MGAPPPFIIDFWLWLWLLFCFMLLYVYTSEYLIWLDQYESHPVHSSAENLLAAGHPLPPLRPPPLITPRSSPLALHKISKSHTPTSDCWPGTGCWGSWPAAILEILLSSTSIKQKKKKKNSLVSAGLKIWQIYFILAHNRDVGPISQRDWLLKKLWKSHSKSGLFELFVLLQLHFRHCTICVWWHVKREVRMFWLSCCSAALCGSRLI